MSIGNTTLRVAQWIVIGIAALGIAASIFYGKSSEISGILFAAAYYLLLIELLRLVYRAVRVWFGASRGLDQNAGNVVSRRVVGTSPYRFAEEDPFSEPMFNPATGLPMMGMCDVRGNFYGTNNSSERD